MSPLTRTATVALLLLATPLAAQELKGAPAALRAMKQGQPAANAPAADPYGPFREDLRTFNERVSALPPAEGAKGWLALAERWMQLKVKPDFQAQVNSQPVQFNELLEALPPPAAWDPLAAAITARKPVGGKRTAADLALLLLAHSLKGDRDAQWKDLDALGVHAAQAGPQGAYLAQQVLQINDVLLQQSGDPARIVQGLDLHLAAVSAGQGGNFQVPDLVTLLGPQKAQAVLLRILTTAPVEVQISGGDATERLARKLALANVARLKAPQWGLAQSLDALPLFEALEKRFAVKKPAKASGPALSRALAAGGNGRDQSSRQLARTYYLLSLIVAGRHPEAMAQLPKLTADAQSSYYLLQPLEALDRAGQTRALVQFLAAALAKNPKLALWELYVNAATRVQQTGPMLKLIRTALSQPDLDLRTRRTLQEQLYTALLAADQVEVAIPVMRRLAQEPEPRNERSFTTASVGLTLARVGQLLNRKELVEEGLKLSAGQAEDAQFTGGYLASQQVELLLSLGRPAAAEEYLIGQLAALARQTPQGAPLAGGTPLLTLLASVYHETGRHADVLTLLDQAPNWDAQDLSELLNQTGYREVPLGYMAAAALADRGEKAQANRVLERLLRVRSDFDPAYALLLRLRGADALPLLDQLYARDQFQERPLIWKAQLLLEQRRLDEAEKVVRQAIAIDPSDGEQHHGRRMRVYSVLADILAARGDAKQAALFRGAVDAIRISERADRFREAGLLTRAIKLYEEALTHFQDAYCIQSRLAVQLAEQGQFAEAEAHYRRAFELMPDSFGRMETHCLGCEGVFQSRRAETIAEGVFRNLVMKNPGKPQLHYLLGYLREQQGRYPEALNHFRDAVKLDPDYINAWKHLLDAADHIYLPQATRDAAALNLARLDPFKRHAEQQTPAVADLRALWAQTEATAKVAGEPASADLYPLRAAKAEQEKQQTQPSGISFRPRRFFGNPYWPSEAQPDQIPTPAEAVASQPLVAALSQIIDNDVQQRLFSGF